MQVALNLLAGAVCLLAVTSAVDRPAPHDPHDSFFKGHDVQPHKPKLTIEEIASYLSDAAYLSSQMTQVVAELATDCHIADTRLKKIKDITIPNLQNDNNQQDILIDSFKDQVEDLLHNAFDSLAECHGAQNATDNTRDIIVSQSASESDLSHDNAEAKYEIDDQVTELTKSKADLLTDLGTAISTLTTSLTTAETKVDNVEAFVDSRYCETGTVTLNAYDNKVEVVKFQTFFTEMPELCIGVIGIKAHIIAQKTYYPKPNILNFMQTERVRRNNQAFRIKLKNKLVRGSVHLKEVIFNWIACQNLNEEFVHTDGATGRSNL